MSKLIILSLTTIVLLTGCNSDSKKINSETYYMENKQALLEKLKYCNRHPDKKSSDSNCINAHRAKTKITKKIFNEGIKVDYLSNKSTSNTDASSKEKNKEYYLKNNTARLEKLEYCDSHPDKKYEGECLSALAAKTQLIKDSL